MIDGELLERVLQLDPAARREFVDAVEESLDDQVPPEILAIVDERLARKGPGPDQDAIPADEFLRRVRSRRSA